MSCLVDTAYGNTGKRQVNNNTYVCQAKTVQIKPMSLYINMTSCGRVISTVCGCGYLACKCVRLWRVYDELCIWRVCLILWGHDCSTVVTEMQYLFNIKWMCSTHWYCLLYNTFKYYKGTYFSLLFHLVYMSLFC